MSTDETENLEVLDVLEEDEEELSAPPIGGADNEFVPPAPSEPPNSSRPSRDSLAAATDTTQGEPLQDSDAESGEPTDSDLREALAWAERARVDAEERAEQAEKDLQTLRTAHDDLGTESIRSAEVQRAAIEGVLDQAAALAAELHAKRSRVEELESVWIEPEAAEASVRGIREDLESKLESASEAWATQREDLQSELASTRQLMDETRTELSEARSELDTVRRALSDADAGAMEASARDRKIVEDLLDKSAELARQLADSRSDGDSLRAELDKQRADSASKIEALQAQLSTIEEQRTAELQEQLERRSAAEADAVTASELREQLQAVETNLFEKEQRLLATETQVEGLEHDVRRAQEEAKATQAQANHQLAAGAKEKSRLSEKLDEARDDLAAAKQKAGKAQAELASAQSALQDAYSEVEQLREQGQIREGDITRLRSEVIQLREQLDLRVNNLMAKVNTTERDLRDARRESAELTSRLTETLAKLGKSEDLVEEARLVEQQTASLRAELQSLRHQLEERDEEIQSLRTSPQPPVEPVELSAPPPVHEDPEAERHIAWLQSELVRANREADRRVVELTTALRRVEQLLGASQVKEEQLRKRLRAVEGGSSPPGDDIKQPALRLRPPRW